LDAYDEWGGSDEELFDLSVELGRVVGCCG